MKYAFVLLILLSSLTNQAQDKFEPDIRFVHDFINAKSAHQEFQRKQASTYELLGQTEAYILVSETVHITSHKSFTYSYDNEVILHFFDRHSQELKFSERIWRQTKQKKARKSVKGGPGSIDIVPNIFIFKNRIYSVSKHLYKQYSQYDDFVAARGVILSNFQVGSIQYDTQYIHVKAKNFTPFEVKISSDSSYMYALSKSLLKTKDRGDFRFGMRFFNTDLRGYKYLPIGYSYGFYAFKNHIIYLSPGAEIEFKEEYNSQIELNLNVFNLLTGENDQQRLEGFRYSTQYAIHFSEVLHRSKDDITLLIGMKCSECNPIVQLHFKTLTIELNGNDERFTSIKEIELTRLSETDEGEQDEIQDTYFKYLSRVDVSKNDVFSGDAIEVQRLNNMVSGITSYERIDNQVRYIKSVPLFIGHYTKNRVYTLERVLNMDGIDKHRPFIVRNIGNEIHLLANFTVPTVTEDGLTMESTNSQVLQFVVADLDDESVYRYNIDGELEQSANNYLFNIDPSGAKMIDHHVFCIVKSVTNTYHLAKIGW